MPGEWGRSGWVERLDVVWESPGGSWAPDPSLEFLFLTDKEVQSRLMHRCGARARAHGFGERSRWKVRRP